MFYHFDIIIHERRCENDKERKFGKRNKDCKSN